MTITTTVKTTTGEDDHGEDDHGEDDHGEDDHGEDDRGEEGHDEGVYATSEVLLRVDSRSATVVPNDPAFGFLGHPGELFYQLPQHEEEGLLYLGIASDEVEAGVFVGDEVKLNLKSVEGPGEVYLYSTDTFGKPTVMFNSADGISESDTFVMKTGAHSHQSMAFSEAGVYRVGFDFSGKLAANGEEARSGQFELLFEVEELTVLSEGEVDLEIVYEDGEWEAEILAHVDGHDDHDHGEDDRGEEGHDEGVYATSEVLLRVDSRSATVVPNDPAFGFLGHPGELFYQLPQHEEEGLLYLGIASDEVEAGVFVGDEVKLNLKSVEGPGEVYLYSTDTFGKPTVMFNSADGISESDTFVMKTGAHSHQSMAFSEAGVYRVGFDFSGKLAANGEEARSGQFELLFEVEELTVLSEGEVDLEIVYEDGEWEAEILAHVDGHDDHDHGEDDHGEDDHGEDDHGEDDHGEDDHGEDDHGEDDHGEDDRGEEGHDEGVYATSEVLLRVDSRSATVVPNDPAFGFLGHPGELFYQLPQHEEEGLLYLGIASDEVEAGVFVGDEVKLNLKSVEGPGEVYLYSTDTFGKPTVMFNSADGISESDTFVMKTGAHSHQSMAFSEAGVYRVGFDFSGKLAANGEEARSGQFELLFEVEELTVLSEGEVDLEIVYEDGEWEAEILAHVDGHDDHDHGEDDHGEEGHDEGVYATSEVLLRVDSRSATVVPNDPAFGFLGHPGELFYQLPQHEEEGLLYLGIASDEVEAGVFVGDEVKLNLKSVEGPGEVYLYSTDTFGKPTVMFNSADGISESDTFVMKTGAHSHQSMAFSEAGVYRVGFDFSGKLAANGEEARSGEFQLLFEVERASSNDLIIDSFSTTASPFSLAFQTESDSIYIIEASHDLKKWGEIGEIQGTGSSVEFTDWRKALFQKQYYRVKLVGS